MEVQAPNVPCRICALAGVDKRVPRKGLSGHLGAHTKDGWSKKAYIERFGPDSATDFGDRIPPAEEVAANARRLDTVREDYNRQRTLELGLSDESLIYLTNPVFEELNDDEKTFYEQNFSLYFQAVDRDEVQIPHVASLVTDLVSLRRLRKAQLKQTKSKEEKATTRDLEEVIEKTEKRIQAAMKSLSLSREAQAKNKDSITSTAAGLIGGYLDEIARNTVSALDALMTDEKKVLAQSNAKVQELVLQYARDLEPEEEESANSDGTGSIFSFKDALDRAQLAL